MAYKHFKARLYRKFFALKKEEEGVASVEFAMVAMPFFAIMFAIFEMAMIFWANGVLAEAVSPVAREVLVGKAIKANLSKEEFRNLVCERAAGMFECENIIIDVRTFANFSDIKNVALVSGGQVPAQQYIIGDTGEIVMVRVGYAWKMIMPFIGFMNLDLSNMSDGTRFLQVTHIFKNEDF